MKYAKSIFVLMMLCLASTVEAANICVRASGSCDATRSYASTVTSLATALTNAVDGDTIYLHAGDTYTGHWTIPNKGTLTTGITIRSDAPTASVPASGIRVSPSNASFMPKLVGDSTSDPIFEVAASADKWTFRYLYFAGTPQGFNQMVKIGSNECVAGGFCQEFESQEPTRITVDQCLLIADPIKGQKRGIEVGGKTIAITNNYMAGMAGLGQDAQAVSGANGHGPLTITNNYMEGAAQTFIWGGDDPRIRTVMTVSGTPTTSSAAVTVSAGGVSGATHNLSELSIGQVIAIATTGGTMRRHTILRSKSGSGTTGTITFDPIPEVPDVPGDIRGGVMMTGVTFANNYCTKPLKWLLPILDQGVKDSATPNNPVATASTSGGTLAAGTYTYYVQAYTSNGYTGNSEFGTATQAVSATLSGTGQITINWQPPTDASKVTNYRIYARGATPTMFFTVPVGTNTFTDTGTTGTATTSVTKPSYWQIKNLFEIKAASNVTVTGNIFENHWAGSDNGYAMWIKSTNQGSACEFCGSRDIVIEKNIFRHVDGWLEIQGIEYTTGNKVDMPPPLTNVTARNNLIFDSGAQWALSKGGTVGSVYATQISSYPPATGFPGSVNIQIYHNTIIHTSSGAIAISGARHTGFVYRDNLVRRNSFGIHGDGQGEGTGSLDAYMVAPYTVTKNAIAGINTSSYPAGNFGPTVTNWENEFVNMTYTGESDADGPADFHLRSDSTYHNAATDGTDVGANIDTVLTATANTTTGGTVITAPPPTITTTSLPNGTASTAYSFTLQGSATGSMTWAVISGSLPSGLSLTGSTGVISGTPSAAGTFNFTIRLTDSATALTDSQALSIVVDPAYTAVSITTTSPLTGGSVGTAYSVTIAKANGIAPYDWAVTSGSLPAGVTLTAATGVLSGVPTTSGGTSFTLQVTDGRGNTASRAFSLTIGAMALPNGRPYNQNGLTEDGSYVRCISPTTANTPYLKKGDKWTNPCTTPPTFYMLLTDPPTYTWQQLAAATSSHNLLSDTHADTEAATLPNDGSADGSIITVADNKYTLVPPGTSNTFWGVQGGIAGYYPIPTGAATRPNTLTLYTRGTNANTWAPPSSKQEFFNGNRHNRLQTDLSQYTQARLQIAIGLTAGSAGTTCTAEYSSDAQLNVSNPSETFQALDGGTGPSVPIDLVSAQMVSPWVNIADGAKGDVTIRVTCQGGNGSTVPIFGNIALSVR